MSLRSFTLLLLAVASNELFVGISAFAPSVRYSHDGQRKNRSRLFVFDIDEVKAEKITTQDLIDRILDESLRTSARFPIMKQFDPASKAIWRHWKGTVLAETWKSALIQGLWAAGVYLFFSKRPHISQTFRGFQFIWSQILAITTFTLTFFVNESYSCWRTCLNICYTLQGRMNDFSMSLAACAKRIDNKPDDDEFQDTSSFAPESRKVLLVVARYIRLFNILSYASFTRSHRPLLTPLGLRRMVARGLLTPKEFNLLINPRVTATSHHNQVLMWCTRTTLDARRAGHLEGGFGLEQNLLGRIQEIRAQGNYMECVLRGRMPFGYAHIVQVLVDFVLWSFPVMAFSYSDLISLPMGIAGAMLLTTTYQGLFTLSKHFLDPFHNENFWKGDDPINVDTLIAETNAGSLRWMYGLDDMPITLSRIESGELDEFVLPNEGYTVEEAMEREASVVPIAESLSEPLPATLQVESYQKEFEQTQAILNTPPGYEFVPGIDDVDEDTFMNATMEVPYPSTTTDAAATTSLSQVDGEEKAPEKASTSAFSKREYDYEDFVEPMKVYKQFVETAVEEYEAQVESEESPSVITVEKPAANGELPPPK